MTPDDKIDYQLERIHDSLAEMVKRVDNQDQRNAAFSNRLFWLLFGMMGLWISLFVLFGFVGYIFAHFNATLDLDVGHDEIHSRLDLIETKTKERFDKLERWADQTDTRLNTMTDVIDSQLKKAD